MRKPVIGVMGGADVDEATRVQAEALGAAVAKQGWVLLTGGRDKGVMAAAARGAKQAGGLVIGILPDVDAGRASPDLDVAVITGMGDGRNLINVLSSDVVVACRGALGTMSEIVLALNNGKTVIVLDLHLGDWLAEFVEAGRLLPVNSVDSAVAEIRRSLRD